MIEQVVEAGMINNRVNLMLLDNLDEAALERTLSARGGRTVGQQPTYDLGGPTVMPGWIDTHGRIGARFSADGPGVVIAMILNS